MELELRWTPNRGQDKFIADDLHTHVHCDALQRACGHAKFWKSRDRYRELIIVGDLNIMHETSAKILQISSWVVPSFIHGNKITAIRLVFFKFSVFLMEKTNERNVHGPKGMVILHNFMCSLLPCLFVFQNVCLFRSVLLMIFAAIFR